MIWALVGIIVLLVLGFVGTIHGFRRYLEGLNERTDRERKTLLDRIQAPDAAVGVSLAGLDDGERKHIGVGLEGTEDDEAFQAYQELTGR